MLHAGLQEEEWRSKAIGCLLRDKLEFVQGLLLDAILFTLVVDLVPPFP